MTRACNGCRRRKIKCDAATTNTWPCSACTRLRLVCIPPSIGQGGDFSHGQMPDVPQQSAPPSLNVTIPSVPQQHDHHHHHHQQQQQQHISTDPSPSTATSIGSFDPDARAYPQSAYFEQPQDLRHLYPHNVAPPPQTSLLQQSFHPSTAMYSTTSPTHPSGYSVDTGTPVNPDSSTADELSGALGELRIDETGIGTFVQICCLFLFFSFS